MKGLSSCAALLLGSALSAQTPAYTHEIGFDFFPQLDLLNDTTALVCGGHLQGIEFSQRAVCIHAGASGATNAWVYNEDDVATGFTTDVLALSDGNVLLYTPEDVALIGANLELHLTKLDPQGNLLWNVDHPIALTSLVYQSRFRVFETSDNRIVVLAPLQGENGVDYELRFYDLDGNFLSNVPVDLDVSGDSVYDQGNSYMTSDDQWLLAGRHVSNNFLLSIAMDGSINWNTEYTAEPDPDLWYTDLCQRANGDILVCGYYSEDGNQGVVQRFDAQGNYQNELVLGNVPDVVITRCVRELSDGRVAVGTRWMGDNEVWSPRLIVFSEDLTIEEVAYTWPTDVTGTVENLRETSDGQLVGINDMILGSVERTDLWRFTLQPLVSVGEWTVERLRIGPNPAVDRLVVHGVDQAVCVVYGLNGQRLLEGASGPSGIEIAHLAAGTYLLEVHGPQGPVRMRWVKA